MQPLLSVIALSLLGAHALAGEIIVRDADSLRTALRGLKSGDTLKIAPGDYPGGHHVANVTKLTIEALDPKYPPHFKGGTNGWQFSRCADLTLRNLRVSGQTGNGLNLDDGGDLTSPVTGITLDHLEISDIGPSGNHDGIKCSGLDKLTIRDCTITGWGGQGIDFVGCHHSLITGCRFIGKDGFTASAGIQLKGGTSDVIVEKCHFKNAGERPLNLGGSTGLPFFRPQGTKFEAARLIARDNIIEGSLCAAAFVGVDGAQFSGNTILFPTKWIFRILQETREPGFAPCRNVVVRDNRIVFHRSQVQTEVNVGGGTSPESFRFERNRWFAEDKPQYSKPRLPTVEKEGVYGTDPR
ncbi:right-handed parallel beta-helix repeat-containing protein [Prosthecobacter sp.]|uniref:right-handed parallel beta-helix repeat-containing protein n=1 Tax=Prosthecobacter sp. TaxID=1965333 RepID=UPI001DA283CF|nr:right-handed parallel beta-helix repeat-containing protein [Prosthecobacter sp.]MCB1279563.1 right-handed parallel beta-helix repeat-containing protein [Prosthecobacter sp.]